MNIATGLVAEACKQSDYEALGMRDIDVFFYGLFMDEALLAGQGLRPVNPRKGSVADYRLKIGDRATLDPEAGARTWGMVMRLPIADVEKLYLAPSVADYRPEAVLVETEGGEKIAALCYNLPDFRQNDINREYARTLAGTAERLGLPAEFVNEIGRLANSQTE